MGQAVVSRAKVRAVVEDQCRVAARGGHREGRRQDGRDAQLLGDEVADGRAGVIHHRLRTLAGLVEIGLQVVDQRAQPAEAARQLERAVGLHRLGAHLAGGCPGDIAAHREEIQPAAFDQVTVGFEASQAHGLPEALQGSTQRNIRLGVAARAHAQQGDQSASMICSAPSSWHR